MEKLKYKNKIKILSSLENIKSLNKGRIRSLAPKPSKLIPNDGIAGKYLLIIISLCASQYHYYFVLLSNK